METTESPEQAPDESPEPDSNDSTEVPPDPQPGDRGENAGKDGATER